MTDENTATEFDIEPSSPEPKAVPYASLVRISRKDVKARKVRKLVKAGMIDEGLESKILEGIPEKDLEPKERHQLRRIMEGADSSMLPHEVLFGAITKVANLYDMIASSITPEEVTRLSTRDKILALQKLSHIHEVTRNQKPGGKMVFNKINVNVAGKDELEQAMNDIISES